MTTAKRATAKKTTARKQPADRLPPKRVRDDQPIFECKACKSEWAPSEAWTPRNWDGKVPADVEAAKGAS